MKMLKSIIFIILMIVEICSSIYIVKLIKDSYSDKNSTALISIEKENDEKGVSAR